MKNGPVSAPASLNCRCVCQGPTKLAVSKTACNTNDMNWNIPTSNTADCKMIEKTKCHGWWKMYDGTCTNGFNQKGFLDKCSKIALGS